MEEIKQETLTSQASEEEAEALEKGKITIKPKKGKKKKKRAGTLRKSYPTRCMKVGEIKCLFLSCFNGGRSPFISLGPSWPFTLFLLGFAALILVYFCFMLSMAKNKDTWMFALAEFGLAVNLSTLLTGILKNPGIPQTYLDRILKEKETGKAEEDQA
jgi:hypothetical protein